MCVCRRPACRPVCLPALGKCTNALAICLSPYHHRPTTTHPPTTSLSFVASPPRLTVSPPPHHPHPPPQLKEAEAARLREDAEAAVDARRFLQEEVEGLKRALLAATATPGAAGVGVQQEAVAAALQQEGGGGGGGWQGLSFEGAGSVRERVARLERENRVLKKQLEGASFVGLAWFWGWTDCDCDCSCNL